MWDKYLRLHYISKMSTFRGQFNCTIDDKGRIKMPVSFLEQFPAEDNGKFIMKKGLDHCLEIYPLAVWEREEAELKKLNLANNALRRYRTLFTVGLIEITIDNAGRFLIPKSLMQYINHSRDVVMKGDLDFVQIWDVEQFDKFLIESLANMDDYSEKVANYLDDKEKQNR